MGEGRSSATTCPLVRAGGLAAASERLYASVGRWPRGCWSLGASVGRPAQAQGSRTGLRAVEIEADLQALMALEEHGYWLWLRVALVVVAACSGRSSPDSELRPGLLAGMSLGSGWESRYGLCPRRPRWPSPGDADSDSTAGSASATPKAAGTANASAAGSKMTPAVGEVPIPLGLDRPCG
jgi:hypothetical protein